MIPFDYISDRVVDSTDNNEYADGDRDENFWEEDIVDTEIPADDRFSKYMDEDHRPEYGEEGFRGNIGG